MKCGIFLILLFMAVQSIGLYIEHTSILGIIACSLMPFGSYFFGRIDEL